MGFDGPVADTYDLTGQFYSNGLKPTLFPNAF